MKIGNYNIDIKQSTESDKDGRDYWKWSLWISADEDLMDKILRVEYILHSSFPNRVRISSNRKNNFKMSTKGWGEFLVHIKVYLKDVEDPLFLHHYLKLRDTKEGEELEQTKINIFISSDFLSQEKAEKIKKDLLSGEGIIPHSMNDLVPLGDSYSDSLNTAINRSDALILVLNSDINRLQYHEVELAKSKNRKVFILNDKGDNIDLRGLEKSTEIVNTTKDLYDKLEGLK